MRRTVAARMPTRMAFLRCYHRKPGCSKADDDGVVAGKNKVDRDDLQECSQARSSKDFHGNVPRMPLRSVLVSPERHVNHE